MTIDILIYIHLIKAGLKDFRINSISMPTVVLNFDHKKKLHGLWMQWNNWYLAMVVFQIILEATTFHKYIVYADTNQFSSTLMYLKFLTKNILTKMPKSRISWRLSFSYLKSCIFSPLSRSKWIQRIHQVN